MFGVFSVVGDLGRSPSVAGVDESGSAVRMQCGAVRAVGVGDLDVRCARGQFRKAGHGGGVNARGVTLAAALGLLGEVLADESDLLSVGAGVADDLFEQSVGGG